MRRREFLLGAVAAAALPVTSWAGAAAVKPMEYALVASFSCGKCGSFDMHMGSMEAQLGGKLHFAPVAEREDDYVVRAWFGLESLVQDPSVLRGKLFKLTQGLMLQSPTIDDVIQWLQLEGIQIPPEKMRDRILSDAAHSRLMRSVALATFAGVNYTPAVVFTRGRNVLRTVENREMSDAAFVSAVLAAKKELTV